MSRALFVTGTDTGIGKTLIACALLRAFADQGLRVVGMKPVAAGVAEDGRNDDVERLEAAGNVDLAGYLRNPYLLRETVAPHLAARHQGIVIDHRRILACLAELRAATDLVIVEGVGGFLVPLGPQLDSAMLAAELDLPVILVVGLRLGCLNHALLTQEAVRSRGLALAGWIANQIDAQMAAVEENLDTLRERMAAPLLGCIPFQSRPDSTIMARLLDLTPLADSPTPSAPP